MSGLSEVWMNLGRSPVDILERNGGVAHIDGDFYRIEPDGEGSFSVTHVRESHQHVFAQEGGDEERGDWGYCSLCGRPMYVCKFCGTEHTEAYTRVRGCQATTTPVCDCEQAQATLFQVQWRPDLCVDTKRAWVAVWRSSGRMKWVGGFEHPLTARRQARMKMSEEKVA